MVDIARKRAKVKPKFVSQSAGERELALQYIGELKQQRGSGADSLHCKICSPVRTFTAPTTLLSHYRSHAGKIIATLNNIHHTLDLNKRMIFTLKGLSRTNVEGVVPFSLASIASTIIC